jgi:hypothetical protein
MAEMVVIWIRIGSFGGLEFLGAEFREGEYT